MSIYEIVVYSMLLVLILTRFKYYTKIYWVFVIALIFISALRNLNVGTDTLAYYESFKWIHEGSFVDKTNETIVFYYWQLFFHRFLNYDWFLLISYGFIILLIALVAKKSSPLPLFSLFLFVTCEYYLVSMNAFRQYIVVAIIMYMIYLLDNYQGKKTVFALVIFTLVAYFIHVSVAVILLLFLYKKININKKSQAIIVIASFITGFFLTNILTPYFSQLSNYVGRFGSYLQYESGNSTRNLITNLGMNIFFLITLFFATKETLKSAFFKAYFISMLLFNFLGSMYWLTRLTDNLSIAQIIVLPLVYKSINKKNLKYSYLFLILLYALSRLYLKGLANTDILPYSSRDNINFFF